jgi:membrane protease YdiL (CAAX protease family)
MPPGSNPSPEDDAPCWVEPVETVPCWRCGKEVERFQGACPHCLARLARPEAGERESGTRRRAPRAALQPVVKVILAFGVILLVSVVLGFVQRWNLAPHDEPDDALWERQLAGLLAVEAIDTLLVVVTLVWVGRVRLGTRPAGDVRLAAWLVSVAGLPVFLLANVGYHWWLREYLSLPDAQDELTTHFGFSALIWLAFCVQPAVVEEVFFRYLALGSLNQVMGVHGAVLISAVMFGLAHVYNPLAIPYLTLLGVGLGYARVASGGLALPVLLHFGHNAVVMWMNSLS